MPDPTSVTGLKAWYRAHDIALADGAAISTWPDVSGGGFDMTQTFTARPTLQTNELNTYPVVRFDGTDDYMRNTTVFLTGTEGAIFAVYKQAAQTSAVANTVVGSADTAGVAATNPFVVVRTSAVAGQAGKPSTLSQTGSNLNGVRGATALGTTLFHIVGYYSTGTAYAIDVDGASVGLTVEFGANNGNWFGDAPSKDNVTIGGLQRSALDSPFNGDIAEVIMYDGVSLSQADKDLVFGYLYTKYFWQRPVVIGAPSQAAQRAGSW